MKKIKVLVKYCGRKPIEKKIALDSRVLKNFIAVKISSDMYLLFRNYARALGHSFNANILGIDFYGMVIFAGCKGDKLTDAPISIDKLKILFPDLFLEE